MMVMMMTTAATMMLRLMATKANNIDNDHHYHKSNSHKSLSLSLNKSTLSHYHTSTTIKQLYLISFQLFRFGATGGTIYLPIIWCLHLAPECMKTWWINNLVLTASASWKVTGRSPGPSLNLANFQRMEDDFAWKIFPKNKWIREAVQICHDAE